MIIALAIAGGLAYAAAMFLFVRWIDCRAKAKALAAPEVQGAAVVTTGRLVGAFGVGNGRVRGTGAVAVHPDRVVFVVATPKRVMELPRALLTDVEVTKVVRFPGRYARLTRPMVVLRAGEAAGMAVLVPDPQALADAITRAHRPGAAGTN
jgi:hypothetical protein